MVTTIETLWKKQKNKTLIAKLTGHDWKTVDKVIKSLETGTSYPAKKPHPRIIDPFKEHVTEMVEKGLSAVRIHEKLQSLGLKVGYTTVRDYIKLIKGKEIFMRIHTDPGEEAQVDFGYVGLTRDNHGKNRRTWVFNMRLSYSRLDYYEKVYNQRVETFINCHKSAFKYMGGVPRYIKIDNLKAAILNANFYEPVYQQLYKSFASHCGFNPIPCRVRQPNDKGKVESGISYVKGNFFAGRTFENENDLNFSTKLEHYPKYKRYSDTQYQEKYQVKMADIGPFAQQLFFKIIENNPRDWGRTVKGVLSLTMEITEVGKMGSYLYRLTENSSLDY